MALTEHPEPEVSAAGPSTDAPLRVMACAMSLAAGLIHAAAIGAHGEYATLSLLFGIAAVFGVGWGVVVWARASRVVLAVGLLVNLAFLAFYVFSRTTGVSSVDGLHTAQPVGTADLLASFFELGVVLAATALLGSRTRSESPRFVGARSWSVAVAVTALCLPALAQASGDPAGATAADSGSDLSSSGLTVVETTTTPATTTIPPTTTTTTPPKAFDPKQPIDLSGTPGVTPVEQRRAEDLLRRTLVELPKWADPAVAEAAGYHSIGDASTGHEHLIDWNIIDDTTMLDPNHPEALVYNTSGGKLTLEAAMFIVPPKYTLKTAPPLGGKLTQWHIHDNLCFTPGVAPQVAGLVDSLGNCSPGLVKFTPAPMVHVWITPNPCGPFAALEGIGAGQVVEGQTRNCDHVHSGTGF